MLKHTLKSAIQDFQIIVLLGEKITLVVPGIARVKIYSLLNLLLNIFPL